MTIGRKIEVACRDAGMKLKHICERAGVKYGTLHQQISRQSSIPFSTVDAISSELGLPLEYFSDLPQRTQSKEALAAEILRVLDKSDATVENTVSPTVEDFWRRLSDSSFNLERLGDFRRHCDIYFPLAAEDEMPHPVQFGRDSLSRSFLGLTNKTSYYNKMRSFDPGLKERSFAAHQEVNERRFLVTTETINETIDNLPVQGCYLRATARVSDGRKQSRTLIFTQFLIDFNASEQKLNLSSW